MYIKGRTVVAIAQTFLIIVSMVLSVTGASAEMKHDSVSVATWNVQVGSDDPVFTNGWPKRRLPLVQSIKALDPDILSTQEGLLVQLEAIDKVLPEHERCGGGRDDGKNKGEFCAIYFRRSKFQLIKQETFWLSDTPETPEKSWDLLYKRICTAAFFKDVATGKEFAVFNTHFPLLKSGRRKSAALIASRIKEWCHDMPVILTGDFNCKPGSQPWKIFEHAGLQPTDLEHRKTYHVNGKPAMCIDGIFVTSDIESHDYKILDQPVDNIYPSDHFGSEVKLSL